MTSRDAERRDRAVRATLQSVTERAEGEWNESGVASEANTTRG